MEYKRKLFIGSSSEELELAKKAKEVLDNDFDVVIWNESVWEKSVFKINESFLDSLLKATLKFDFGLIIGTNDDEVKVRRVKKMQPRDNILFELGLFIGKLGISKCAFIVDEKISIPSDLKGITLARFKNSDSNSFEEAVRKVKDSFISTSDIDVNVFPSTTLAYVYYENFIKPTCRYLIDDGHSYNGNHYDKYKVLIVVPDKITEDVNLQIEQLKRKIKTQSDKFNYNGRPRTFNVEVEIKNDVLRIVDFPTIISGINYTLSHLIPDDFNQKNGDYINILNRELRKFMKTLKKLILDNGFDEIVTIVRESEVINKNN